MTSGRRSKQVKAILRQRLLHAGMDQKAVSYLLDAQLGAMHGVEGAPLSDPSEDMQAYADANESLAIARARDRGCVCDPVVNGFTFDTWEGRTVINHLIHEEHCPLTDKT